MIKITPSQQGQLDSFCGIYSIVNAMSYLFNNKPKKRNLNNRLIQCFDEHFGVMNLIELGINTDEMDTLLSKIIQSGYYARHYPVEIKKPFKGKKITRKKISKKIEDFLSDTKNRERRIVLFGTDTHWTLINGISKNKLELFDSAGRIFYLIDSISTKKETSSHFVTSGDIYFLSTTELAG